MATDVKLPRLGQGMESGVIVRWLKSEGDAVSSGEPLYELDTDKVTQEVEAETSTARPEDRRRRGRGRRWLDRRGDRRGRRGGAIRRRRIHSKCCDRRARAEQSADADAEETEQKPQAAEDGDRARGAAADDQGAATSRRPALRASTPPAGARRGHGVRVKASPLARRIARERGIDLAAMTGTGPEGRILAEDVERAAAGGVSAAGALRPRSRRARRPRSRCSSSRRFARRSPGASPRRGRRPSSSSASRRTWPRPSRCASGSSSGWAKVT